MCQSFSKNMGLYNERAGCVSFVARSAEAAAAIKSQLAIIVRHMYSNPPAHGAQVGPGVMWWDGFDWIGLCWIVLDQRGLQ